MSDDAKVQNDAKIQNDAKSQDLVPVIAIPRGHTTMSFMTQARRTVTGLAVKYKRYDGNPPMNAEVQGYLTFLQTFLPWLETDAIMTPAIRDQSRINLALQLLSNPDFKCPVEIATRARRIYDKFEDEQWGEDNRNPESEPEESSLAASQSTDKPKRVTNAIGTNDMYQLARVPPHDHPIWGRSGIMHGFVIQPSQFRKFNYVLDPRYEGEKRSFKVIGHNSLNPGDWWPYQKVALFHGAHGHSMAGISGQAEQGAWSVVVSGSSKYQDLDQDLGDIIWYSNDGSHNNLDPTRIVNRSNMALSLHTSVAKQTPIRVLRSSGKGRFAPSHGIRYDGLYLAVKVVERTNAKGGLYEQFQLRRQPGQRSLQEICQSSPTQQQVADFERVQEGY
ncbi:hypothetical protein BR93DRAFT_382502 [Coniochaeta sp. PMI_546]|nr:hypothetical protein BR93DRAFT_382502 [Coniochaeta sp. PMI_546]